MDRTGQSLLGKYELTRMLGKGGMGEVWEGTHSLTGRRVAVKILADNYLANKKVVARFGREARAASSVNHPGIVEILDQDRTPDDVPFLVMEFLEGESVGERLRARRKLPQDDALAIMLPLLDALDAAHRAGVIHRDLEPDNVFILPGARGEERIKILDFGISQKSDEIENRLTQEGSVLGTPHYMSPEQAKGEAGIDVRVDVYAAGVMFYECVVGDVPFDAGNYNALMQIILGAAPPAPRSRGADISLAVEQVILASMDKVRTRRPPSARAFHDLLLEAGVQEDDAMLDITTWSFTTPSEPPPPIDFGDMPDAEFDATPASLPPAVFKAVPAAIGTFGDVEPQRAAGRSASLSAQLPAMDFSERDDLEANLFSAPTRNRPQFDSLDPVDARQTPAPQPRFGGASQPDASLGGGANPFGGQIDSLTAPRAPFDPTPPLRHAFDSATARRGGQAGAAPQRTGQSVPPSAERRVERRPAPATAAGGHTVGLRSDRPSLGRTILNWVVTLAALGALGYLMRIVFTRPDPRKPRPAQEASESSGTPSQ